jgi:hypothetical protein
MFLKSTASSRAPGIYELDLAAKPPGKTFSVFLAIDPEQPPTAVLNALVQMGYHISKEQTYKHRTGGMVKDLQFEKDGTDLFKGWTADESAVNLSALDQLFSGIGVSLTPRVMTLAEAYR